MLRNHGIRWPNHEVTYLGRLDASKNAAIAVHRGQRLHRPAPEASLSHGDFIDRAECVAAIACAGKFIANFILPRVSEMSGPYQMFGQLFDVYFLSKEMNVNSDEGWLLRYEEVPRDFIPELVESARKEMIHNLVSSFCHAIQFVSSEAFDTVCIVAASADGYIQQAACRRAQEVEA